MEKIIQDNAVEHVFSLLHVCKVTLDEFVFIKF